MGPVLTVIGEALVDLVPKRAPGRYRENPGGSPFNVAVGLARLGNRTLLMARFSDDRHGRLLRAAAAAEGIDLRGRGLQRDGRLGDASEDTLADVIDEAVLVSAITCEREGANPPRLDELAGAFSEPASSGS